ncbi:MAG: alpha/beta fold hydrolase, partial [Actinomycetota bacterium]
MPLFDGISQVTVTTPKLKVNVLVRDGDPQEGPAIVLIHGNVSSALFWQELMLALPKDRRVFAIDLRGFGGEGKQALVLLDGLRAVEPVDNSVTWQLYPVDFLRQIEV